MFLRRKQSGRLIGRTSSRSVFNGTLVILLSFCILLGLFGWKNASAEDYACGLEEHTHTTECYESTLICDDTEHEHTDECYEQTLICDKTEHTHSDACLAADETEETVEQQEEAIEDNAVMALALDDDSGISAQADTGEPATIDGSTPPNTVINLFDYWTTDSSTPSETTSNSNLAGIDKNGSDQRPLLFWNPPDPKYTSNWRDYGEANIWTGYTLGDGALSCQGIVQNQLGADGYPLINWDANSAYWPTAYRNDTTLQKNNTSLAYLFNSTAYSQTLGKRTYSDVGGLFQIDDEGYYYYNCTENYAYYSEKDNSFVLYDGTPTYAQFFPFATYKEANTVDGNGNKSPRLNHYFGLTMTTRFVTDHDGHISAGANANDMVFDFSGDDDVWIFIDDVLVSDLGGIHSKTGTRINFATGEVLYYVPGEFDPEEYEKNRYNFNPEDYDPDHPEKTYGVISKTTLQAQFDKVYKEKNQPLVADRATDNNGWQASEEVSGNYIFSDDSSHTLKFFYMERGNNESNMRLTTNLAQIPQTSITKVDQEENPMGNVPMAIYEATASDETDSSTYYFVDVDGNLVLPSSVTNSMVNSTTGDIQGSVINNRGETITTTIKPKLTGTTESTTGEWIFADENGSLYTSQDLIKDVVGSNQMIIREIKVPDGYRTVSDNILLYFDHEEHLTTPNAYESGVWPSPNVLVTASNTLYKASGNNEAISYYDPTTGESIGTLFAVVMKRNGAALEDFETTWYPVYGDDSSGYKTTDSTGFKAVLEAYQNNAKNYTNPTFTKTVAGMQVYLTDLPGSLDRYYTYMLEHASKEDIEEGEGGTEPQYCVCYFYSTKSEDDLKKLDLGEEGITEAEAASYISRVVSHQGFLNDNDLNENYEGFYLKWSSTIKITNIEDRLYFQKSDDQGNLVDGATFALYNAGEDEDEKVYLIGYDQNSTDQEGNKTQVHVYLGADPDGDNQGKATVNNTEYDYSINSQTGIVTIGNGIYTVEPAKNAENTPLKDITSSNIISEKGTGRFNKLLDGRYVLREISAPDGYLLNTELVRVLVNEDGVYANAGIVNDGVIVGNGVGFVIPTFNNCASQNDLDETLTWVYSLLRVNTDNSYNAYDSLNVLYAPKEAELDATDPWKYASAAAETGGMSGATPTTERAKAMVTYLQYDGSQTASDTLFDYTTNSDQSPRTLKVEVTEDNEPQVFDYSTAQGQDSRRLYTDEGWSELSILQDYAWGQDNRSQTGKYNSTTYTNLTTQNAYGETNVYLNIANLFSNSTFVRVTDPRTVVELNKVKLNEVDGSYTDLPGASFIAYRNSGDNAKEYYKYDTDNGLSWESSQDKATTLSFNGSDTKLYNLVSGTYYLQETQAPAGYVIETKPWKLVLDVKMPNESVDSSDETVSSAIRQVNVQLFKPGSESATQEAVVYLFADGSYSQNETLQLVNTKIYELPSTGSIGVLPFILVGSLILGFSVYLLIREERQTKA